VTNYVTFYVPDNRLFLFTRSNDSACYDFYNGKNDDKDFDNFNCVCH
jgi:hypothetical protein